MSMYLFVILLILSILYFIFVWKHDLYGKYKHESCFIKIRLYSTYPKKMKNSSYGFGGLWMSNKSFCFYNYLKL